MKNKKIFYISLIFFALFFISFKNLKNLQQISNKNTGFDTSNITVSVSPFDDFDKFANGKWKDTAKLPLGYSRYGSFIKLNDENEIKIRNIIEESALNPGVNFSANQQIGDLYSAFIDTQAIEKNSLTPIKAILNDIDNIKNLKEYFLLSTKHITSLSYFYGMYVSADIKNSKMNGVYFGQSGLSIGDRDYYVVDNERNKFLRSEFVKMVKKQLEFSGMDSSITNDLALKILQLETEVAKIQITKEERRDPVKTYNKILFNTLDKENPDLYLAASANSLNIKLDSVIVQSLIYLKKLNEILKSSDLNVLKNWLKFKLIDKYSEFLPLAVREADRFFYNETLNGIKTEMPRDKKAIKFLNSSSTIGNLIGKIYVQKYFSESAKSKIAEMIENMRDVFKIRIQTNKWMSDTTKKEAINKLQAFTYKIGFPNKWKNYSNIVIEKSNLISSIINLNLWQFNDQISKIDRPVDKEEWLMTPQQVNAYFFPPNNEIVFPAGILQPPFYNENADEAINYGAILSVIGHEFTHGFDDKGSQFDGTGNLKNWWRNSDREKFKELAKKFGENYKNFKGLASQSTINPEFTMGENIADLGGLTLAYYALEKSIKKNGVPKDIDGYNYKQRFFLGWAQVYRGISTMDYEKNQVINDPHSPAKARANVPTSLMLEFEDAWKPKYPNGKINKNNVIEIW